MEHIGSAGLGIRGQCPGWIFCAIIIFMTSNEKIFKKLKSRNGEKLKKQDGVSTIIVNYSNKK